MGNKACCCDEWAGGEFKPDHPLPLAISPPSTQHPSSPPQNPHLNSQKDHKAQLNEQAKKESTHKPQSQLLKMPELSQPVKNILIAEKIPLEWEWTHQLVHKRFQEDEYWGQMDESGRFPHGQGRFFKKDGSLYLGVFHLGKAEGKGIFIFPDNSYYCGQFAKNRAEGQGIYKGTTLQYVGGFHTNLFHGEGKQKGPTHSFSGEYQQGNKKVGLLQWSAGEQKYEYFGTFVGGLFQGKGTLKGPTGTYKGEFTKGEKHGKGVYQFINGLRYQGQYRDGQRNGRGAIYNSNNTLAYSGEFWKGLPHGEGNIKGESGVQISGRWVEGIDEQLL